MLTAIRMISPMYLLGYLPAQNRVYLADKDLNVFSYNLSVTVIDYQSAILRGDLEAAAEILPSVPKNQLNRVARFLETQGKASLFSSSYVSHPSLVLTACSPIYSTRRSS